MQITFNSQVKTAPWNKCLNQLTYIRIPTGRRLTNLLFTCQARGDGLNPRPRNYMSDALTSGPRPMPSAFSSITFDRNHLFYFASICLIKATVEVYVCVEVEVLLSVRRKKPTRALNRGRNSPSYL